MRYEFPDEINLFYNWLKGVYPDHIVNRHKDIKEDGTYDPYYFDVWKNKDSLLPLTMIAYDLGFKKAFIATSSDGVLEEKLTLFFDYNGVKSGMVSNIQKDSIDVASIPFDKIRKL